MSSLRPLLPILLLLVVPVAAFFMLVHQPAMAEHRSLNQQIDVAAEMATALPVRLAEIEVLTDQLKERETFLATHRDRLPATDAMSGFAHRVGATGEAFGLTAFRVEPLDVIAGETYRTYPYRLSFEADAADAVRFLGKLERPPMRVRIEELSLAGDGRSGRSRVNATVQVDAADPATWKLSEVWGGRVGSSGSAGFNASSATATADPS